MMLEMLLPILVFFPFIAGLVVYVAGSLGQRKPGGRTGGGTKTAGSSGNTGGKSKTAGISRKIGGVTKATGISGAGFGLAVVFAAAELLLMFCLVWKICLSTGGEVSVLRCTLPEVCGFGLHFVLDGFRMVYGSVAVFMWLMATLLSGEYFREHKNVCRFYLFLFWTLGATMGVFLSADLYTLFIFFEIMSFTSYVWVAQEENRPSLRAAETYLAVAVIGGLVMLMGIFLVYHIAEGCGLYVPGQPLYVEKLKDLWAAASGQSGDSGLWLRIAGFCMLFGFGAKAGAFPVHIWLPEAHPVAPAPASALLSGILTKAGIYGTLILSCQLFLWDSTWGKVILFLGVVTMLLGAVLAVFSIDLKRTLACSSVSQIGFILVGIGMQGLLGEENALAVHGTMLHMVNHSLIKLVLFLAAGVVYWNTHSLDLNKIRGWGRKKPLIMAIFLTGALAVGGIPMFGGYVSKTLLHEAIVEYGGGGLWRAVEYVFLFSGGLTVAYMTKLFAVLFLEKNQDEELQKKYDGQKRYMGITAGLGLTVSAIVLFVWGLIPEFTMNKAAAVSQAFMGLEAYGDEVRYFSLTNLQGALISVLTGAVVYVFFVRGCLLKKEEGHRIYVNAWPTWLNLENLLYRPLLLKILPTVCGILCRIPDSIVDGIVVMLRKTVYRDSPLPYEKPEGNTLTTAIGGVANAWEELGNRTWNKKNPRTVNYKHLLALKNAEFKENNRIIARSLSFGLFLAGIGLGLTLIYLVWY
ncbi:MAG: complex I subunit 5 family protein [Acetatifactor sp.]